MLGSPDYNQADPIMKQTLVNLLVSDYQLDLTKMTTPTSLIWETTDRATPLWQAQRLQQQLPNLVPGAGHNLHRTHSQLLAQSIDRQLQSLLEAGR